ncbi:hypothetical protein [Sulfurirhabdus autotrophica]|uniref:Uncharacterized protein n=1 Tax=Sulfurirhabdus autotrophica TaxID=1706046 RepID=A0A4R3Y801_9PROT|nr:hypothetical protein [Sulfurirhabdus autotrophica]TCV86694.1 hypothetical protein EDC63_10655 [Sulfurirhabdus autotrophica]
MRIKTVWFRKDGDTRGAEETAGAIASILWRLSDAAVINLSKAEFDIITPQRGFGIMAELQAFMVHLCDRMLYDRVDEDQRVPMIQTLAKRLATIMEDNIHMVVGDHDYPYQADFIAMVNRRSDEYATYDFIPEKPSYSVLTFLGNQIREIMGERDQSWVVDQIIEIETPEIVETIRKAIDGLLNQP